MPVTRDIVLSYRDPAPVLRRKLGAGVREDRALAVLMLACALIFVAQWPRLAREAHLDPEMDFGPLFGGSLLALVFILPLLAYGLAALSHIVLKPFGAAGDWHASRLALFWAMLAAVPLWLLNGLVAGLVGPGPAQDIVGFVALAGFLGLWFRGLWAVEFRGRPAS